MISTIQVIILLYAVAMLNDFYYTSYYTRYAVAKLKMKTELHKIWMLMMISGRHCESIGTTKLFYSRYNRDIALQSSSSYYWKLLLCLHVHAHSHYLNFAPCSLTIIWLLQFRRETQLFHTCTCKSCMYSCISKKKTNRNVI